MRHLVAFSIIVAVIVAACNQTKPTMTGRLSGPTALAKFRGCPQNVKSCSSPNHLLLIANSLSDDLRIFDVDNRNFFQAREPLFPLSIPVGELPVSLAVDPLGQYAFVVNAISQNVSLIGLVDVEKDAQGSDLLVNRLVELDTDADTKTCDPDLANSNRCIADVIGVSRVDLRPDINTDVQPEYIVAPQPDMWDTKTPLRVYVSLLIKTEQITKGKIAVLNFQYPDSTTTPPTPQKLTLQTLVDIRRDGSMPSGLALTKDGSKLFVADEGKDPSTREDIKTIYMIDTSTIDTPNPDIKEIDVGGPSSRLALNPDQTRLYVIHSKTPDISVVDVTTPTGTLCAPCSADCSSTTPDDVIHLEGMPRSVAFVEGLPLSVNGLNYTFQSSEVTIFAFVSNLDGDVYVVDGENHCLINSSTTEGEFSYEKFVPTVLAGMAGELISGNFIPGNFNDICDPKNNSDACRIYLLYEGSDAMMEFFPSSLSSTDYLLYQ